MRSGSWGIRARWVLPIHQPSIEDGLVIIRGPRIVRVTRASPSELKHLSRVVDLGQSALMPGMINAHTHLEFPAAATTRFTGGFTAWLEGMIQLRSRRTLSDYQRTWRSGAAESLASGVTTVANIESRAENLPELWDGTPLRVFSFFEVTNVRSGLDGKSALKFPLEQARKLKNPRGQNGLSPHAAYSARADLLRETARASRKHGLRVTSHLGESKEEHEMFLKKSGALHSWLGERFEPFAESLGFSPVEIFNRAGLLSPRFLAVHLNQMARGDLARISRSRASVVHCPRSHAYFGHEPFPWRSLHRKKVNCCLGTDSRSSLSSPASGKLPVLSMLEEMREFQAAHSLSPAQVLMMATQNGARALGMEKTLGDLIAGKNADLVALKIDGRKPVEEIVQACPPVCFSMIDGEIVFDHVSPSSRRATGQ